MYLTRALISVVAAISALSGPLQGDLPAPAQDEILLFSTGGDDGEMMDFFVSASSAKRAPAWNPERGEPPLSMRQAAAKAVLLFRAAHPSRRDVVLEEIRLNPIEGEGLGDKWFYTFRFSPEFEHGCTSKPQAPIVIFMDGTAAVSRLSAER